MHPIDRASFHFSPAAGVAVAVMVGFLVFAAALDLKTEHFARIVRHPRGPLVGLFAQFGVLPAVAFVVGHFVGVPSVALGLLLVACCPGGALSNYLSSVAHADVAASVSMTALSTVVSIIATPLIFTFWASLNPATATLLESIAIEPARVALMLAVMLIIPLGVGMGLRATRPALATRLRVGVRRAAAVVFGTVVTAMLGMNLDLLFTYAAVALLPALATFVCSVALGLGLAYVSRLGVAQGRAVALEVGMQNVALAIGTAMVFFPALHGVAVTATTWGVVQLTVGLGVALVWARMPAGLTSTGAPSSAASAATS